MYIYILAELGVTLKQVMTFYFSIFLYLIWEKPFYGLEMQISICYALHVHYICVSFWLESLFVYHPYLNKSIKD